MATVHRASHLDYFGIKRFDAQVQVTGECRFLGLYTSNVYNTSPTDIPVLRRKVALVLERAGFPEGSHSGKDLQAILETYPRDELFQISDDELFDNAMGILQLQDRQRVALFVQRDRFGRFFSCLVFVPRERYSTETRQVMQAILREAFHGVSVEYTARVSESLLARSTWSSAPSPARRSTTTWRRSNGDWPRPCAHGSTTSTTPSSSSAEKTAASSSTAATARGSRPGTATTSWRRWPSPTSSGWNAWRPMTTSTCTSTGRSRAGCCASSCTARGPHPRLRRSAVAGEHGGAGRRRASVRDHALRFGPRWIYDFGLECDEVDELDTGGLKEIFQETFAQVWRGEVENDGFNRLVLRAGLTVAVVMPAGLLQVPAPDLHHVQPGVHRGDCLAARTRDRRQLVDSSTPGSTLLATAADAEDSQIAAGSSPPSTRGQSRPRPHPAELPRPHRRHAAHELLPATSGPRSRASR